MTVNTAPDTRDYITSLAFKLDPSLLGLPLARPVKRLLALMIDLMAIGWIAGTGDGFLLLVASALCFAGTYFLYKNRNYRVRTLLLGLFGSLLLISALGTYYSETAGGGRGKDVSDTVKIANPDMFTDSVELDAIDATIYMSVFVKTVAKVGKPSCKIDYVACLQPNIDVIDSSLKNKGLPAVKRKQVFEEVLTELEIPAAEIATLLRPLTEEVDSTTTTAGDDTNGAGQSALEKSVSGSNSSPSETEAAVTDQRLNTSDKDNEAIPEKLADKTAEALETLEEFEERQREIEDKPTYSLIAWVKGIASDLGLSFGFAAVYFSTFIAYWSGQTPGKWCLGIRVLRLDGKRLNLWDAFGRYGGYGAGLATGLLGFLQIYWDSNRMTIQDKISETVVIDLRKASNQNHAMKTPD